MLFLLCPFVMCLFPLAAFSQKMEVRPYIEFVGNHGMNPVDYVFKLFESNDIVILGERDHRDMVQYELFIRIISDQRFVERVGNIFTEVGVHNVTKEANSVLKGKYASEAEFEQALRVLYRKLDYEPLWEKTNFWTFLSSIHRINTFLPLEKNLNIFFTDISFDWEACRTSDDRARFIKRLRSIRMYIPVLFFTGDRKSVV